MCVSWNQSPTDTEGCSYFPSCFCHFEIITKHDNTKDWALAVTSYFILVTLYSLLHRFDVRVRFILYSFIVYKVLCILTSTFLFNLVCCSLSAAFNWALQVFISVCVNSTLYLVEYCFSPFHLDNCNSAFKIQLRCSGCIPVSSSSLV